MILAALIAAGTMSCSDSTPELERTSSGGQNGDGGSQGTEGPVSVTMVARDNVFEPGRLKLPEGSEVTLDFVNKGDLPHTFTIRDLDLDTGTVAPGTTKRVKFVIPGGTTPYVCTIHEFEGHVGEIVQS